MARKTGYGRGPHGYRTPVRSYVGRRVYRRTKRVLPKSVSRSRRHLAARSAAYASRRAVDQVTARGKWAKFYAIANAAASGMSPGDMVFDKGVRSAFPELRAATALGKAVGVGPRTARRWLRRQ